MPKARFVDDLGRVEFWEVEPGNLEPGACYWVKRRKRAQPSVEAQADGEAQTGAIPQGRAGNDLPEKQSGGFAWAFDKWFSEEA